MSEIEVRSVGGKVVVGAVAMEPDDALDLADKIAAEAAVTGAKFAGMGPDDRGGWTVNVQPSAGLQRRMVAFLCEWLGPAENYTETGVGLPFDLPGDADSMSYSPKPAGQIRPYILTVQRDTGKSPHQKRIEAEAERDRARDTAGFIGVELAELRHMLEHRIARPNEEFGTPVMALKSVRDWLDEYPHGDGGSSYA